MNSDFILEVNNVSKHFHGLAGSKLNVLEKINFKLKYSAGSGSAVSILAPYNSGKTTLLKIISAIEKPEEGDVIVSGEKYKIPDGRVAYIPEKPSSFSWMNVKQNIEFSLKTSAKFGRKNSLTIDEIISKVGLTGYEDHFPHEKSLGFRFRISLARALAAAPQVILLDDPFINLHGETKKEIQHLISGISVELNLALIFSTTNVNEALTISDSILLMSGHPARIISTIEIDKTKKSDIHSEYFSSLKNQIEKLFHDNDKIPSLAG